MRVALVDKYYNSDEYLRLLQARAKILKEVSESEFHRARLVLDVWSSDPIAFIETFLFVKLPNYHNAIKPFFLFDYQKKIINHLLLCENSNEEHTILIDKPREMGITWTILAYCYWRWLFTPNWSGFLLSRSEAEVDDNSVSPDSSLFGKLRWLQSKTPKFLLPENFRPRGKKGTDTDMSLKLLNPALQTALIGSTTNASAGRSRRYSMTAIDEAFYIENFKQVWRSLESVSRVKVFFSSAKQGKIFKDFAKMCEEKGDYISLTWKDHPWKDLEWYNEKLRMAEFDPEVMKEVEVSYAVSREAQYYPQISEATIAPAEYDPTRPLYVSLDIGRADLTVLIWWQYHHGRFYIIECYSNKNRDCEWYAPFLNPELAYNSDKYKTEVQQTLLKKVRSWKKPAYYFGEAAHLIKVMPTNRSIGDEFYKFGIRLTVNNNAIQHEPRRRATSAILPLTVFNENSDYVMELYDAIANSKYANSVNATSKGTTLKPVHGSDGTSDYRSAFENGAANIQRILFRQRSEKTEATSALARSIHSYLKS